ncbi:ras GTPase-activating-like protein IQGAP2 [Mantella aurantiaca]
MVNAKRKTPKREGPPHLCVRMCRWVWSWLTSCEDSVLKKRKNRRNNRAKPEEKTSEQNLTDNMKIIVKIQSFVRGWKIRKLYKRFQKNPSIEAIREFIHLLDPLDIIFLQRLEIIDLKEEVVTKMRHIQQLREELDSWDKKISPLVNGKKMLENLVSRFPKLRQKNQGDIEKQMSMEREYMSVMMKRTEMLKPYQHLFYYLQTDPKYLSKLICHMSPSEYATFGERLLHKLYSNASTPRDEYHLVKFLKSALKFEVEEKCTQISDILDGRSMAIKTVFRFYRQDAKYDVLLQKLTPVITEITSLASSIRDNPLAIRNMASKVIESICIESFPFGVRYVTKVLSQALKKKFPQAAEDEILGTLGLFWYQYIQPVIEASDDFGPTVGEVNLNSLQRENLMAVAKLVHHTMSITFFTSERGAFALDVYVLTKKSHFWRIFEALFKIPEPEQEFVYDYYSDILALKDVEINLPAVDIVETHALLVKYEDVVFPDKTDVLCQILKDLGPVPHWKDLLSEDEAADNRDEAVTEICLSLSSKCIPCLEQYLEMEALEVITKKLIYDVIRVQPGESLSDILLTPASPEQIEQHEMLMRDTTMDSTNAPKTITHIVTDHHLPLEMKKGKILMSLNALKVAQDCGLLKITDDQDFLKKIAKNISRRNEIRRKQEAELTRFRDAVDALDARSSYYQEQIEQYKVFYNSCLENLVSQKSSNACVTKKKGKEDLIRYNAAKLHKKGVIVDTDKKTKKWKKEKLRIDIDADHQIKVSNGEMFLHLHVADILDLHYSNQPTKEIFDYNVNVSLLLFMVYSKVIQRS